VGGYWQEEKKKLGERREGRMGRRKGGVEEGGEKREGEKWGRKEGREKRR